jgi:hypothetical protein
MTFQQQLSNWGACANARKWVGDKTLEEAWEECSRADWMVWLLFRVHGGEPWSEQRKKLIHVLCEIIREVLPIFERWHPDDTLPHETLAALDGWRREDVIPCPNKRLFYEGNHLIIGEAIKQSMYTALRYTILGAEASYEKIACDAALAAEMAAEDVIDPNSSGIESFAILVRLHYPTFPESL